MAASLVRSAVRSFGRLKSGEEVLHYTLRNKNKLEVQVISYGATITAVRTPDKSGAVGDVVLGFDGLEQYEGEHPYFGVVAGRIANRIAGGLFTLDGKEYKVATNNGDNHLHGGIKGFDKQNWSSKLDGDKVRLTLVSPDGDEGYPGTLTANVAYELTDANELVIEYSATTDAPTILNLTNHAYFNLAGPGSCSVEKHVVEAPIKQYTPSRPDCIPTGEIASVKGTPFDFTKPHAIGDRIGELENGYDHNLCVNREGVKDGDLALALKVEEPGSGRSVVVKTTEPGIQLYTGGFLGGEIGREGKPYTRFGGMCLETQHYPDSINQPQWPSVVLRPGEKFASKTVFEFPTPSTLK